MSLLNVHRQREEEYTATLWARWLHNAPHVNITFHHVAKKFDPQSDLYKESLVILASIPAAWLIATLVVLLIYLCTRCCDSKSSKRRKSRPMRCCLSFFALVGVATVGVGFWGNQLLNEGIVGFEKNTDYIDTKIKQAQHMVSKYNEVMNKEIHDNINKLYDGPFQDIREIPQVRHDLREMSEVVFTNITAGLLSNDDIRFDINDQENRIDFKQVPFWSKTIEKYRWPTTMVLQSLFGLFCLLLFVGAIVHSRCVLILFSVFGLFSIIFLWLLASAYTLVGVGLADFCMDPTPWVQHIIQGTVKTDISAYYLQCNTRTQSPFAQELSVTIRAISDINDRVTMISGLARKNIRPNQLSPYLDNLETSVKETVQLSLELQKALQCEPIFRSYNTALASLCDSGLLGIIVMLLSCAVSGILFTMLVWCNSHTWIYFKHKGRYIKVDDADPYMPLSTIERPRPVLGGGPTLLSQTGGGGGTPNPYSTARRTNIHTPPQTPPYHGTLNGAGGGGMGPPPPHHMMSGHGPAAAAAAAHSPYGHLGTTAQRTAHHNHMVGTLGRNGHQQYQGLDNLPATMTLGRRGHYGAGGGLNHPGGHGVRSSGRLGVGVMGVTNEESGHAAHGPLLGGGGGQYATLSKQCKTLESSDFY